MMPWAANSASGCSASVEALALPMIEIVPYDPAWPQAFEEERLRIAQALGSRAIRVEHHVSQDGLFDERATVTITDPQNNVLQHVYMCSQ